MKSLLTIDGIDGSGKSTFCRRLHEVLTAGGVTAIPIRVDDFRRGAIAWDQAAVEATAYYDAYYDLAACDAVLRAFLAGERTAEIPVYDIAQERRTGSKSIAFEGASVAVIEGVFPLRMPSVQDGVLIYLETTEAEARRRILARDHGKGRSQAEIERRIDKRYFPSQRIYRDQCAPRERADVIIDNERPVEPRGIKRDLGRLPPGLQKILGAFVPSPDER